MLGCEVSGYYEKLADEADRLLKLYGELRDSLAEHRAEVDQLRARARNELAAVYLPRLGVSEIAEAERLTGFRGFARRNPMQAMAKEKVRLESEIARLRADERYRRREYLVGPEGEFARALAEAREMLEPWDKDAARFEDLDGFLVLVDLGYDTPDFMERWWQASYWTHWARGDAICEALGMDDFGDDVLPAYREVVKGRTRWRKEVGRAEQKVNRIHQLVRTHDEAVIRLRDLVPIYLDECRVVLAEHLALADPALLAEWSEGDRGVLMALARVAGLQAKHDFFHDAIQQGLQRSMDDLRERAGKYRRKAAKYLRSKHAFRDVSEAEVDRKFVSKIDKLRKRHDKLAAQAERVMRFDDYGRFDLSDDPELWWFLFSEGKRPSRLTPSLREWYERHPGASPSNDAARTLEMSEPALAAASAARELDDAGYLS